MIAALATFLTLYQSSPGPLSAPHAKAISGTFIKSCSKCHTKQGLTHGCLDCHEEIARQLDEDLGYHAYLFKAGSDTCQQCHPEHHGKDFPLVSEVAWPEQGTNTFNHPHVEFKLKGKHETLGCEKCHATKLKEPFALTNFPKQKRTSTMLGLEQDCISCHEDIHKSGDLTRDCTQCHNQDAFKPAPYFDHDKYYVREGVHARIACSACHQVTDAQRPVADLSGDGAFAFGPVKGKACSDCHETPHRFEVIPMNDCLQCHQAADEKWVAGQRGVNAVEHARYGFALDGAHVNVKCASCHAPELPYALRYPDPSGPDYLRRPDQCRGCHQDPHGGQFLDRHPSCLTCHQKDRFKPSILGPSKHSKTYPLLGGHQAAACIQCHRVDSVSGVRQFTSTPTECKACHTDPHGEQFREQLQQGDCTACHLSDFSTFKISPYTHKTKEAFFAGEGHSKAACQRCHTAQADVDRPDRLVVQYRGVPSECAACHQDVHRGQFLRNGQTDCERCHDSTLKWSANRFSHEQDSTFSLGKSHLKVACAACHLSVPQPDGQSVVQYRPLNTRCEDCHEFKK